jgi:hypothetical protein
VGEPSTHTFICRYQFITQHYYIIYSMYTVVELYNVDSVAASTPKKKNICGSGFMKEKDIFFCIFETV